MLQVHHTKCGMLAFNSKDFNEKLKGDGIDAGDKHWHEFSVGADIVLHCSKCHIRLPLHWLCTPREIRVHCVVRIGGREAIREARCGGAEGVAAHPRRHRGARLHLPCA